TPFHSLVSIFPIPSRYISIFRAPPPRYFSPSLNLRIDYMHPAEPHKDVYGFAECYRVTPNVIFTRGFAYQDDPGQPIAHVVGAFMRMGGSARAGAARPAAQGGAA
ncbi:PaaI family thioesterase, partial [Pseudomonas aeruginosa]|uniref:PaaI family thioesterase n=1 Tax=Pseudomonas aeruginosa TaxID=287 RepID=UPI003896A5CC